MVATKKYIKNCRTLNIPPMLFVTTAIITVSINHNLIDNIQRISSSAENTTTKVDSSDDVYMISRTFEYI